MSAATETSHVSSSQHEAKAASTPQSDNTSLTSTLDPSKLTALWADSAGLLILYFTCVPPSKQVRQTSPAVFGRESLLLICLSTPGLATKLLRTLDPLTHQACHLLGCSCLDSASAFMFY